MSQTLDKKNTIPQGNPESTVTHTDTANLSQSTGEQGFKFKLSLPGKDIGGNWLRRNSGDALAYQNYCVPGSSASVFKWYKHSDGKSYLQSEEGYWLSYESIWQLLYMSSWTYAVAWKMEGNRLIRESDGAVLTWYYNANWPLADRKNWLSAEPESKNALSVEIVEAELIEEIADIEG